MREGSRRIEQGNSGKPRRENAEGFRIGQDDP